MEDQFQQKWSENIHKSPKTMNYRIYKTSHNLEKFMSILSDRDIITLMRFRTMNHRLPIERGRWNHIQCWAVACLFSNIVCQRVTKWGVNFFSDDNFKR